MAWLFLNAGQDLIQMEQLKDELHVILCRLLHYVCIVQNTAQKVLSLLPLELEQLKQSLK